LLIPAEVEVEIRNFVGQKIVKRVTMQPGVDGNCSLTGICLEFVANRIKVEISKNQKDQLELTGISLENVSQSAADIQQVSVPSRKFSDLI
jgi:large subunit ribosomal protein L9e